LHDLLERSLVDQTVVEGFLVAQEFPRIGPRIFLLHARKVLGTDDGHALILLGFEDITERRAIEQEKELLKTQADDLLQQKEVLLAEMQHRIVNSLQIIASILMLKARAVTSEETRQHLQDAHRRVMSVAAVQQHLHASARVDSVEIAPYLSKLCNSLAESMIGESRPATLTVTADKGWVVSADAISLGLIVTELVINALKYAFPDQKKAATVKVDYEVNGTDWKLSVSDNGVGRPANDGPPAKGGLGTSLVKALAHQLDAQVQIINSPNGMSVSVTHATFVSRTAA
jgi:two-component sensor histidine kinase